MKKSNALLIGIILLILISLISVVSVVHGIIAIAALVALEILSRKVVYSLREHFPWIITPLDEMPKLDPKAVAKFAKQGFDAELGWVRKPLTKKAELGKYGTTSYYINKKGARANPQHEKLPSKISCYGDSFAFCRQVNDDETWEWHLSEITKSNVLNFAVGNYGLDQSLLRLKREYPQNKTKMVIMGVVPSTIVRILDVWKHYNEYGNTFGFKPRFVLRQGRLRLERNVIDNEDKLLHYEKYLADIKRRDYFYKSKFRQEMLEFPYFLSILADASRNIPLLFLVAKDMLSKHNKQEVYKPPMKVIMKVNLKLRYKLYHTTDAVKLMEALVREFCTYASRHKFRPVFLMMPQKDDVLFIREKKDWYYASFLQKISSQLKTIDLTKDLINRKDLDELYSDDNKYGGHYSKRGNKLVAQAIARELWNA